MTKSNETGSLNIDQLKELQDLCGDMIGDAEKLVEDYTENPSELSSSVVYRIHENSPYVDENFSDTGWKHVLKTDLPPPPNLKTAEDILEQLDSKDK